jgi:hypothetical protein
MTERRPLGARLTELFAEDAPDRAPLHLRDAVDARLDAVSQDRPRVLARFRGPEWPVRQAIAISSVAVATFVIAVLLTAGGGIRPTPAASGPSPSSGPAPSSSAQPATAPGPTPKGEVFPGGVQHSLRLDPPVTFDNVEGWTRMDDEPRLLVLALPHPASFVQPDGQVDFDALSVYADPIAAEPDGSLVAVPGIGRDARSLAQWLHSVPQVLTTAPVPATVGGASGWSVDVSVSGLAGQFCGVSCVALFSAGDTGSGPQFGIFKAMVDRIYFVNLKGGRTVMITIEDVDGHDVATTRRLAQGVIDSMDFAVGPTPS